MNPIRIIIVLLLLANESRAQELTSKFTAVEVNLDGVFNTFKQGDSCVVTAPDGFSSKSVFIDARAGANDSVKTYRINVQTPGLTKLAVEEVQKYDTCYVRKYRYRFPVTMQVMDKSGTLLRSVTVVQDDVEFSSLVDSAFLSGTGKRSWSFQPFMHDTTCLAWTTEHEAKIEKRLAENAWDDACERIRDILDAGYGSTMYTKNGYNIYLIKSPAAEQIELQELCKRMQKTINTWGPLAIRLNGDRQAKLGKMADEFVSASKKTGLPENLRFLCLYNASVCALLSGQGDKAVEYYNGYIKINQKAGVPIRLANNPDADAWRKYNYRSLLLHASNNEPLNIPYITE
ncbi:hypothetical protein [Chitinophaga sancti]|uniref:hypothetical protein n=1 Tax=Chitinophaga sancti TaxID=1004 RepID=UPI003F7B09AC